MQLFSVHHSLCHWFAMVSVDWETTDPWVGQTVDPWGGVQWPVGVDRQPLAADTVVLRCCSNKTLTNINAINLDRTRGPPTWLSLTTINHAAVHSHRPTTRYIDLCLYKATDSITGQRPSTALQPITHQAREPHLTKYTTRPPHHIPHNIIIPDTPSYYMRYHTAHALPLNPSGVNLV